MLSVQRWSCIGNRSRSFSTWFFLFITALTVSSCIAPSTKAVVKIGLLASFEGLYRSTGYNALAAMRAAIADHEAQIDRSEMIILPLAIDLSLDPKRAAEKIVADPAVKVVIAPAALNTPEIASVIATSDAKLVTALGVIKNAQSVAEMSISLWAEVAQMARRNGADRLVLAGLASDSLGQDTSDREKALRLPIIIDPDLAAIQPLDAVLWFGNPAEGAAYLNSLRSAGIDVPFWMGPMGGETVFADRLLAYSQTFDGVYWATWSDEGYDAWAVTHQPADPAAYLVYRTTELAIAEVMGTGAASTAKADGGWRIQLYALTPDGRSIPYRP